MADDQATLTAIARRFEHDVTTDMESVHRVSVSFAKGRAYLRVLVDPGSATQLPARYGGLDVHVVERSRS